VRIGRGIRSYRGEPACAGRDPPIGAATFTTWGRHAAARRGPAAGSVSKASIWSRACNPRQASRYRRLSRWCRFAGLGTQAPGELRR